jgi:EmrB/QacA subfamily drug resistance transporter
VSKKPTNKWLALITISLGTFMATLNSSIVNIANPILAADFGISMAQVQWVTTIYLIVTSSLMLLFGRVGDRVGSHTIYIVGIVIFTAGSLACTLSDHFATLTLARAIQGLGAAMTIAVGMGLVTTIFPLAQRGRAMGVTALMVGLGNVAGPAVGGLILAHFSWHFVFLLSVPFGLVSFILSAVFLRSPLPRNREGSLDVRGSILFTALIACLIVFLSGGFAGQEWFGLGFVALLALFIYTERREKNPLLEPELLRNKRFILGNIIAFFSYCAHMMVMFQLPFFLDTVWAVPVGMVGLLIMVNALALGVCGPLSGFASDRIGAFRVMVPALVGMVAYILAALFLGADQQVWLFVGMLVLAGAGMGFLNTPNNSDIMTAAGRAHASYASGFVGTNRNLAFCLGTALSASIFSLGGTVARMFPDLPGAASGIVELDYLFNFRLVLLVCLLFVLISLGVCLFLMHSARQGKPDEPERTEAEHTTEQKPHEGSYHADKRM